MCGSSWKPGQVPSPPSAVMMSRKCGEVANGDNDGDNNNVDDGDVADGDNDGDNNNNDDGDVGDE